MWEVALNPFPGGKGHKKRYCVDFDVRSTFCPMFGVIWYHLPFSFTPIILTPE
jgi:hypothetical protein